MPITVTKNRSLREVGGKLVRQVANIALDNSYPTGGYPIAPSVFNARAIIGVEKMGSPAGVAGGYVFEWDTTNNKLMVFLQDAGGALGEVANATDLSAVSFTAMVTFRQGA